MSKKPNNSKQSVEEKTSNKNKSGKGKPNKGKQSKNKRNKDATVEPSQTVEDGVESNSKGNINDATYYYEDATVAEQIQSYSFNQFASVESNLGLSTGNEEWKFLLPNCMSIMLNPCVPITNSVTGQNGVTTSGLKNFLWLVYGNARSAIYGPQDVIIAELAVGNMIATRTWLMRAMCVPFCVDFRNRAYPDELLAAMHIDADDMRKHLAQYRIRFNTITAAANKIPFPSDIKYFKKAAEMFANVYVDDDKSVLAQSYMFNPATVWELDEQYDTDGSGLKTIPFVSTGVIKTFDKYLDVWESQISALLNSTTMNYVYADILRLAQKGLIKELLYFDSLPEVTDFSPIYNTEIQLWIHNMQIMGFPEATPSGTHTIYNDVKCAAGSNSIVYDPEWIAGTTGGNYHETPGGRLLDFYTDSPSIEDKVAATRLSAAWNVISPAIGGNYYKTGIAMLDYYVGRVELFSDATTAPMGLATQYFQAGYNIGQVAALSHFRWNPALYLTKAGSYDGQSRLQCICGELNYYTVVDESLLARMYDYEIINLLAIGDVTKG